MENKYYVYMWFYKSTGEVFHVGKGTGNRYKDTKNSRNQYFKNVINKSPDDVDVRIYKDELSEEEAFSLEKQLIKEYKAKGECKTNFHEGGKGGYTGKYDDPERKRKLSEWARSRVGPLNPMYHKHQSERVCRIISEANKGKKLTPEHVEKLRLANTGRQKTAEEIEKLRKANSGKKLSQETVNKMIDGVSTYEYDVTFNGEAVYSCIGCFRLFKYCKEQYNISRTIVTQILDKTWTPKFNKHKWLANLQIDKRLKGVSTKGDECSPVGHRLALPEVHDCQCGRRDSQYT